MIFTVYFNQQRMVEWDLNANQAALVSLLNQVHTWAELSMIDGKPYFWVSRQRVTEELPGFFAKADTVYRAFRALVEKGLIEYVKHGNRDMILLTPKIKLWNIQPTEAPSEKNPALGNKSEARKNIRESSEKNPNLLGNKSDITDNQRLNNHRSDLPPSGVNAHARESAPPCPASEPAKRTERATRIPADFPLTDGMRTWAEKDGCMFNLEREHENFCDYWTAKEGKEACKKDWIATWRRWMRKANDDWQKNNRQNFGGRYAENQHGNRKLNPVERVQEAQRRRYEQRGEAAAGYAYGDVEDGQFVEC